MMLANGVEVWVTTTTEMKVERFRNQGLNPVLLNFDTAVTLAGLPRQYDYVLNSVPASSRYTLEEIGNKFCHVRHILEELVFKKHVFLSSVGIYPDSDGFFDENWSGVLNERLLSAEQEMLQVENTIIFRLGGLFGKNRILAKYFSGKVCKIGTQSANFIHLDDVVMLLAKSFSVSAPGGIYNIVAPEHPTKQEVILASAAKYGFDLPLSFEPGMDFQKIVSGRKITECLDYTFKYPSPLYF